MAFLTHGQVYLIHIINLGLLLLGAYYFVKFLAIVTGENRFSPLDLKLIFLLFIWNPLLLSNSFNLGLDFPIAILLLAATVNIFFKNYITAFCFGLILIFTKETGALCYLVLIILLLIEHYFSKTKAHRIKTIAILSIPVVFYGVYLFFFIKSVEVAAWVLAWSHIFGEPIEQDVLTRGYASFLTNRSMQQSLFNIFALQFNWIWTIIIGAYFFPGFWRRLRCQKVACSNSKFIFMTVLFFVSAVVCLSYRDFNNPRYVLIVQPWLMLLAFLALKELKLNPILRTDSIVAIVILIVLANFATIDPVSRNFYGTFKFGKRRLLHMTNITTECCGRGRDQLVYNLQYQQIEAAYHTVQLHNLQNVPIVVKNLAQYYFCEEQYASKLSIIGEIRNNPICHNVFDVISPQSRINKIWYVKLPNFTNIDSFEILREKFNKVGSFTLQVGIAGYSVEVFEFIRKPSLDT
jgi:hypothetical protein